MTWKERCRMIEEAPYIERVEGEDSYANSGSHRWCCFDHWNPDRQFRVDCPAAQGIAALQAVALFLYGDLAGMVGNCAEDASRESTRVLFELFRPALAHPSAYCLGGNPRPRRRAAAMGTELTHECAGEAGYVWDLLGHERDGILYARIGRCHTINRARTVPRHRGGWNGLWFSRPHSWGRVCELPGIFAQRG